MCFFEFVQSSSQRSPREEIVHYEKIKSGKETPKLVVIDSSKANSMKQSEAIEEDIEADLIDGEPAIIKEIAIPQEMIGEVIGITERSRRGSHDKNMDKVEQQEERDWPQYLTEEEMQQLMHLIQENNIAKEQIKDDGTFQNQYDSSVLENPNYGGGEAELNDPASQVVVEDLWSIKTQGKANLQAIEKGMMIDG